MNRKLSHDYKFFIWILHIIEFVWPLKLSKLTLLKSIQLQNGIHWKTDLRIFSAVIYPRIHFIPRLASRWRNDDVSQMDLFRNISHCNSYINYFPVYEDIFKEACPCLSNKYNYELTGHSQQWIFLICSWEFLAFLPCSWKIR